VRRSSSGESKRRDWIDNDGRRDEKSTTEEEKNEKKKQREQKRRRRKRERNTERELYVCDCWLQRRACAHIDGCLDGWMAETRAASLEKSVRPVHAMRERMTRAERE